MTSATGHPASTIHKLLEPRVSTNPVSGQLNFSFQKNEHSPIDADLLVIDETSMVTNALMASVLKAVNGNTKLVFVGDKGQLPSVGCGAVLRDMLASKVIPSIELTEIQRNSGDIVKACHKINEGKFYYSSPKLKPEKGWNLKHIEEKNSLAIQQIIKTIVCDRMPKRGYDPIWDVQVLSPTNKKTDLSCEALNQILQQELNPNSKIEGSIFKVGDKIIQTKNDKIPDTIGVEKLVVNGDMGKILKIEGNNMTVAFYEPDRTCLIPLKKNNLLLAYAITCHRAQGSEFPVVIIPVHSTFGFFIDRCWLYTAISRASDITITVGEFQSIRKAISKKHSQNRITKLKKLLQSN